MKKQSGLSLIELLIVITIVSIVTLAMIPSMSTFFKNQRTQAAASSLATALRLAKSEAIEHQSYAGVCLSTDNTNTDCGTDWDTSSTDQKNWIVFLDLDSNRQLTNSTKDRVIKIIPGPQPKSVEFSLSDNVINGAIIFSPMGFYSLSTDSTVTMKPLTGCTGQHAQVLKITATGTVSINNGSC
jgi:prepilin-type N-terminal cleavage/methylation domain-containing protein